MQEANSKLKALVQASPAAIVGLDLHGKVISWNPAAESIFGWRQDEVIGRSHPHRPEKTSWKNLSGCGSGCGKASLSLGLELRRLKKDGSQIDVSLSNAPAL